MTDDRHDRQPRPPRARRAEDDAVREHDAPAAEDVAGAATDAGTSEGAESVDRGAADAVPADRASADDAPAGDAPSPPSREALDALAGQLVWRIGRTSDDAPLTVRVGLAGSTPAFAELPRLRNASDAEVQAAIDAGEVRVEWVGPRGR